MLLDEIPLTELEQEEIEREKERKKAIIRNSCRRYTQKNMDKILARQRKRYREDPEYREYRKRIVRKSQAKSKERKKQIAAMGGKTRKSIRKPKKYQVCLPGHRIVEVEMVQLSYLANKLKRKQATIRLWEKRGIIPEALYRTEKKGIRLYTMLQVLKLQEALDMAIVECGLKNVKYNLRNTTFPEKARKIWEDYPYGIDLNKGE